MIYSHEGKVIEHQESGPWSGDLVTLLEEKKDPQIKWSGPKINMKLLTECAAFFRYVMDKHDSEAQVRLYCNGTDWKAVAMPQWVGTGMTSNEIDVHATWGVTAEHEKLREDIVSDLDAEGYMDTGTNHSHCSSSAFQSGVDLANELKTPGIHLTFGHLDKDKIHVHGRVTFRGILYEINYNEWVDLQNPIEADAEGGFPQALTWAPEIPTARKKLKKAFPSEWRDCCFVKTTRAATTPAYGGHGWNAQQAWYQSGFTDDEYYGLSAEEMNYAYGSGYKPYSNKALPGNQSKTTRPDAYRPSPIPTETVMLQIHDNESAARWLEYNTTLAADKALARLVLASVDPKERMAEQADSRDRTLRMLSDITETYELLFSQLMDLFEPETVVLPPEHMEDVITDNILDLYYHYLNGDDIDGEEEDDTEAISTAEEGDAENAEPSAEIK